MLKEKVIEVLKREFGELVKVEPSSAEFAVFAAKQPSVGNIAIIEDGRELIVYVGNITHGHFGCYEPGVTDEEHAQSIAEDIVDFLTDLFADKYVFFKSKWGGGWIGLDSFENEMTRNPDSQYFVWSGPI